MNDGTLISLRCKHCGQVVEGYFRHSLTTLNGRIGPLIDVTSNEISAHFHEIRVEGLRIAGPAWFLLSEINFDKDELAIALLGAI